jgi:hypothetical protein
MNMGDTPSLLKNDLAGSNHWIQLRLEGSKSNRSAIGATVRIEVAGGVQTQSVLSQSSYVSQNDFRLHFGLGSAARVDRINVRWPSGTNEQFPGVSADGQVLLVEGSGTSKRI